MKETKITRYEYSQVLDFEAVDIESFEISDETRERIERMNEQIMFWVCPPSYWTAPTYPPKPYRGIIGDLSEIGA